MVSVEEAEKIIFQQCRDFGTESISFDNAMGRVLAESIVADRDLPPFNRVTMDGIAIDLEAFKNGQRSFSLKATQAAGEQPIEIDRPDECIEIMTGAVLPGTTNAVIPYEEIKIKNGIATLRTETVLPNQFIHSKGKDKRQNEVLVEPGQFITPAVISVAATVGKTILRVKKPPAVVIISTGDELTPINETPTSFQLRRSNNYMLRSALAEYCLHAEMLHLPDQPDITYEQIKECLKVYHIILISGGVSMGKFDLIPPALESLGVKKLFHKVQQRPGKPFWFGTHPDGALVFAFPGNPVSSFMCFYRYFLPWLKACWGINTKRSFAQLNQDFAFKPLLQYFLQVKLTITEKGELSGTPLEGNGSGDFANLLQTDAFMELPLARNEFKKGEVFPVWPFKQILS
jgi:molybdopterin molybdotransferase